ncbi:MAG: ABC transporter substrate-binding protein [Thermoprotei archaeon]
MFTLRSGRHGISTAAAVAIVVVVIIIIAAAAVVVSQRKTPTSSSTSTTSSQSSVTTFTSTTSKTIAPLAPKNSSVLVDDSWTAAPDGLDPAFGFFTQDDPVISSVFQSLVEMNGTSLTQTVPVIASGYTVTNSDKTYTFNIRSNITFSNGDPVNASTVWFSYVRELYMGQAVGFVNYLGLTLNGTTFSDTGIAFPWGLRHALAYATGNNEVLSNTTLAVSYLNSILSNWAPSSTVTQKLMSYPDQAYVVTGPMTFQINLLVSYPYFLTDIAAYWGAVVDPAFVDAHGGVQANTANSYFDNNGGIGTGPYVFKGVGSSLSEVTLVKNSRYWAVGVKGLPPQAEPAHIPVVVVDYGLSHTDRVENFAQNQAQLSLVSIPFFGQMYDSYQYRSQYTFSQILRNYGPDPAFFYFSLNTQRFPTSNNDFRLAVVHAINYTAILDQLYGYNGTSYAQEFYGPIPPSFPLYKQVALPNYQYNINLAASYLNKSLWQMGYTVTMPNGTVLGNPKDPTFPAMSITAIAPISPSTQTELEIIMSGLNQLGLQFSVKPVTATVWHLEKTQPSTTPRFVLLGWIADWPDPYNQLAEVAWTTLDQRPAWMNVTAINNILYQISFLTNSTQQVKELKYVYNYTYWYAPYAYMPDPDLYLFVQPYVHGLVYNTVYEYTYNTIYYSN